MVYLSNEQDVEVLEAENLVIFEESEILREVVLSLEQELSAARQVEKDCCEQIALSNKELEACNKELVSCNKEILLLTTVIQESQRLLQTEQEARWYLEQKLLNRGETVESFRQEAQFYINELKSEAAKNRQESVKFRSECARTREESISIRAKSETLATLNTVFNSLGRFKKLLLHF